jgi:predicted transcriptional regulator YdeE
MVNQTNEARLVSRPGFRAAGIRWEGTFAEAGAGGIRKIQKEFRERLGEVQGAARKETLLGLSYHAYPGGDGFVHFAAVQLEQSAPAELPPGMTSVDVPVLEYACCEHRKGQSIDRSYRNLYAWIEEQGYRESPAEGLTHFEEYPMEQDSYDPDPEFTILIPVQKA